MTPDLFLAILAMDAYNRTGGDVTNVGLSVQGASIGGATLALSSGLNNIGFFAQAYDLGGQKIISYRGTDDFIKDPAYGWPLGVGVYSASQAVAAAQFFQQVVGNGNPSNLTLNDLYTANVQLTGHSMGGGFAGLIAALYGQHGRIFDSMTFANAANTLVTLAPTAALEPEMREVYFRGESQPNAVNTSNLQSYEVAGQALAPMTKLTNPNESFSLHFDGILDVIQRHSQSLLVIRMYAEQQALGISSDWQDASKYVLPALFNDAVAMALGAVSGGATGTDSASGKMRTMIAYSAIDQGDVSGRIYGDTGIRALYNDAVDLGKLFKANGTATYLLDNKVQNALADFVAEYSGLLAWNKKIFAGAAQGDTGIEKGTLYYNPETNRLIGDFSHDLWQVIGGPKNGQKAEILGIKTLTDAAARSDGIGPSTVDQAVKRMWPDSGNEQGTTKYIVKLVAATKADEGATLKAAVDAGIGQDPNAPVTDGAMLVGADKGDTLVGAKGNDLLIGGKNDDVKDHLIGGRGDDLLFGGAGQDFFSGYTNNSQRPEGESGTTGHEGNDWMDGGHDWDLVSYSKVPQVQYEVTRERIDGKPIVKVNDQATGDTDYLYSIEGVWLTQRPDWLKVRPWADVLDGPTIFYGNPPEPEPDGGEGGGQEPEEESVEPDKLDFSESEGPVYVGSTAHNEEGYEGPKFLAELHTGYEPETQPVQYIWNAFIPVGEPSGTGFKDRVGLGFTDFEHVVGSSHNDIMDMWWLNPSGELSEEDSEAFEAARNIAVALGDPAAVGAALSAALDEAAEIKQNQQEVIIEGGAGDDFILGTRTGFDKIYGGEGIDHLYAGGFSSEVYGGAGIDHVEGGGFGSHLYGGDGETTDDTPDLFVAGNNSFVMDATKEDFVTYGSFRLTGGVQQWWMEAGWAYWSPFSSIVSSAPMSFLNVFGAISAILDTPTMQTFRYGLTDAGQLVVQFARGRGQAVIENYELDIDSGEATGNIVAIQGILVDPKSASLQDFENYVRLALKAGFGTDPLVLDLDGDGLEFARRGDSDIYFDLDGDDFAERTAWVKSDDGLLARDLNANGTIDDIGELFGNATTTGFAALTALDSNTDGKISASDTEFGTLRVWRDLDQNGVTDAGELKTLAESGITEISLSTATPATGTIKGNTITAEATFTRTDGTTSTIADVVLDSNQTDSRYEGDTTVSPAAAALPNLKGYGDVTDLAVAMTNDATLLGLVSTFKDLPITTTWTALKDAADDILFRWAGVDTVSATAMGGGTFDQQKLAFLEDYFGYELTPRDGSGVPAEDNLAELIASWDDVLAKTTVRLAAQGPMATIFDSLPYDVATDRFFSTSPATLAEAYEAAILALSSTPSVALAEWTSSWGPILAAYTEALVRHDRHDIRTDFAMQSLVRALDGTTVALSLDELVSGLSFPGVQVGTTSGDTMARGSATGLQVYMPGAGNDTVTGGAGQDVYVFGRDFGQDTITDSGEVQESGDRIRLALYNPSDVTIRRDGIDLVIEINGTTDKIVVDDQFATPTVSLGGLPTSPNRAIEEIQFADGTIYEAGEVAAAVGRGTSGNDTIDGSGVADEIEGLEGDDLLAGGDGGDLYYYSRGDGNDTIREVMTNPLLEGVDTLLLLGGITAGDLRLVRDGASDDLRIEFAWSGDSVTIEDQFAYGPLGFQTKLAPDNRIEAFFFQQGSAWNWLDVQANLISRYTTSGNDTTYGFGVSDQFYSSTGNDMLVGFDGGDTYRFGLGSGQDTIEDDSRYPETLVSGLIGYSWGPDDVVLFGDGIDVSDVTFARTGAAPDLLITIDGSADTLLIKGQFDGQKLDLFGFLGISWFDRVEQFKFADGTVVTWEDVLATVTTGTAGNDALYGAYYQDTLDGQAGNDFLSGENDGDIYVFGVGYGNDVIKDGQTNILTTTPDKIQFKADVLPEDVTFARVGTSNDLLITLAGGDTLLVQDQFAAVGTGPFGTAWWDRIEDFEFLSTNLVLTADDVMELLLVEAKTTGDDVIHGFWHEDVLDGGAGNDYLAGAGEGDDYIWGRDYDNDTVYDLANILADGDNIDRVLFTDDVVPTDVLLSRPNGGDDLVFTVADTGETLTVEDQFSQPASGPNYAEIEEFRFDNGTVWTLADIRARLVSEGKTAGNDTIYGFHTADVLDGGAGDDRLEGQGGGDTYVFGRDYGHDTINAYIVYITRDQEDTVEFAADVEVSDVRLSRSGDDLILTISGTDDQLVIEDQFSGLGYWTIENFAFADNTVWTWEDVQARMLTGTSGDDTLVGFTTADYLDGGAGNDLLQGNGGGDTFVFDAGYGADVIDAYIGQLYYNQPDTIEFGAGLTPAMLSLARSDDDLIITVTGTGDQLTILDQFSSLGYWTIENFHFANDTVWTWEDVQVMLLQGTSGNDVLVGYATDDTLDGGAGNDVLKGRQGNDTYVFGRGYGADIVNDDNASVVGDAPDRIVFGPDIVVGDLEFVRASDHLVIRIAGTADSLTVENHFQAIYQISSFEFEDSTVLTAEDVQDIIDNNAPGTVTHLGTSAAETIDGTSGDDVIDGLGGDDVLRGANGADWYLYGIGSGSDQIEEIGGTTGEDMLRLMALNAGDVELSRTGNDLFVGIISSGETVKVKDHFVGTSTGIEKIRFTDGTTWNRTEIESEAIIRGTSGPETLNGTSGNNKLQGLGGNDTLYDHSGGVDTYIYASGDGNDLIDEQSNNAAELDVLRLTNINSDGVTLTRNDLQLYIDINATGERITDKDHFWANTRGIDKIVFADNVEWDRATITQNAWLRGTSGAETLYGSSGAETFQGKEGNDTLYDHSGGADTYIYASGDGNDLVDEQSNNAAEIDVLKLTNVNSDGVTLTRSGLDLYIDIVATGERITDRDHFWANVRGIDKIVFADNVEWDRATIAQNAWIRGTSGNDTLSGTGDADMLDGLAGNDTIYGNGGDDIFVGGLGDDTLRSGAGSDTHIYASGDGNDLIDEESGSTTDVDILKLTDLDPADVSLTKSGVHLIVNILGTGHQITIDEQFYSTTSYYGIEQIQFADQTVWDRAYLAANAAIRGTSGNDTLSGTSGNDLFIAGLGNDTVNSGAGSDTHLYASGDGNDLINEESGSTSEVDVLKFTDLNASDITLTRSGLHLTVNVTATGHQITLDEQYWSATENWGVDEFQFANSTTWDRAQIMQNAWNYGTSGDNSISGWASYDNIDGQGGNDTLNGNAGVDKLIGGTGNDTLTGGSGDDKFIFDTGFGQDTIMDLTPGSGSEDVIEFRNGIFADFAAVQAAMQQVGSDVQITVDGSNGILLKNVTLANLDPDDFLLL